MVIGNGMLAQEFIKYVELEDIVILASGVSNSQETREIEFLRERDLVAKCISENFGKTIVYFSTSSMYDPMFKSAPYTRHKLIIEDYVKKNSERFVIFRVSQIIGRSNNRTLINFIIDSILQGSEFELWGNCTRNLVSLNNVFTIIDYILSNELFMCKTINIANPRNISMTNVVKYVEESIGISGKYKVINKGLPLDSIEVNDMLYVANELGIKFDDKDYYINAIKQIIC